MEENVSIFLKAETFCCSLLADSSSMGSQFLTGSTFAKALSEVNGKDLKGIANSLQGGGEGAAVGGGEVKLHKPPSSPRS